MFAKDSVQSRHQTSVVYHSAILTSKTSAVWLYVHAHAFVGAMASPRPPLASMRTLS